MTDFLLLAFIFLVAGVFSVPIASRLGLGSVLGYLIAGIAISPLLALLQVDVLAIQHFAEFGVVMMLFLVGLELQPAMLWSMRGKLIGLGGGQVVLTTAAIMCVAMLLGQSLSVSLAVGLVLALSSTAIVLQTLNEKGLMKSDGGQASFSVLLSQDIAVIPMLALVPLLALPELMPPAVDAAAAAVSHASDANLSHGADESHGSALSLVAGLNGWQTAVVTLIAIAFVILGGSYLTRPMFRFIASARLRELFVASALLMIIGIALLMSLVGLSPALGTFLAGVVLANSEYRHELESNIEPFKGLLLGLFFMTVGAGINFVLLFDNLLNILLLTLGLIALKCGVLLALGRLFKLEGMNLWLFGLGLAQAGEFGFVLLSFTVASSVIPAVVADQLLLVVALSMLLTPVLFIIYDRLIMPRYNKSEDRDSDEIEEASKVIIAGHGRIGGIVDRMLSAAGYKATVIDYSSAQLDMLRKFGIHAYYGDATRPDMLHAAGIEQAKLLVIAIDGKEQITELVYYVAHNYPNVHVMARAVDRTHVYELWAAGCRDIVRETYDSSTRMGRSAYEALGISRSKADQMTEAFSDMDKASMITLADVFDVAIPPTENEAFMARVREISGPWQEEISQRMTQIIEAPDQPNEAS